ncbi:MAG: restriction endonuclease [Lachnospiraceae bacterium]|nr:restriction endonuclease [Lachnospiraceae bacterium]
MQLLTDGMLPLIAGVLLAAVILTILVLLHRRNRKHPVDMMEGHDFEYYCADLLKAVGFASVKVTTGSRDFGADILAERDGVTYAVQCKRYDHPVGVFAVQEIYAARDYYDRMVGVVMTNAVFTEPARTMAEKLKILLWDREDLKRMEGEICT